MRYRFKRTWRVPIAPTTISTADLTPASGGFVIVGIDDAFFHNAGHSVVGGGDIDGDGYADLMIGAPSTNVSPIAVLSEARRGSSRRGIEGHPRGAQTRAS